MVRRARKKPCLAPKELFCRQSNEVYIEFIPVGKIVKVSAIDAKTGLEVSVMGPARKARPDLQKLAVRKLNMRLKALKPVALE